MACAVAKAGIDYLVKKDLLERSSILGERLAEQLRAVARAFPRVFSDTRGRGYLHGLELMKEAAPLARNLRISILEHGAFVDIMSGAGIRSHGLPFSFPAIRVAPPLIAGEDDINSISNSIWSGVRAFVDKPN